MGLVERIEYDPNCSSWIVLVRWIEGVLCSRKRFALSKANNQRKEIYGSIGLYIFVGRYFRNPFFCNFFP
jgi:hypothetical protein